MTQVDQYNDSQALAPELPLDNPELGGWSIPPKAVKYRFPIVIGLVWGVLTGFSSWAMGKNGDVFIGIGLATGAVLTIAYLRSMVPVVALFTSAAGLMVLLHVMAAVISSALSLDPMIVLTGRYLILGAAFSVMLAITLQGMEMVSSLRIGLTLAGLCVAFSFLQYLNPAELTSPSLRILGYLNPNSVGMICAITALSLTDYAIVQKHRGSTARIVLLRLGTILCVLIIVASKSRTATASLIAGWLVLRTLHYGLGKTIFLALAAFVVMMAIPQVRDGFLHLYELDASSQRFRDISTLTGRTSIWMNYLAAWRSRPFLGVGPGGTAVTAGIFGHNAIIQYLAELGLFGTLPVFGLLFMAFLGAFRQRKNPGYYFFTACIIAALVESIGEASLLNSGNPASLIVLLSFAVLATVGREKRREPAEDDWQSYLATHGTTG
ncbi:MAG TPA: O-antigen ligase family protein [Tepidisphaeraceae bacterium]|nr:O-antigen ligase family protein [Tepidisphaeraceae bacterium]